MKTLEVRRHSFRKQGGGSQLSQKGVDYARKLGASMGPFSRVVTSVVPRTRETAIAMGFAVDEEVVTLSSEEEFYAELEINRWWESPQPFVSLAELLSARGAAWRYAHALSASWRDILTPLEEGASALVIAHSGDLEMGLVGCFTSANHSTWGAPFGPCEGARLSFGGDPSRFIGLEMLRGEDFESV